MGVSIDHLQNLYSGTDDPWGFKTSEYEQQKFAETRAALSREHYQSAFEMGCGNGQLAGHLADVCAQYTGMDAVAKALDAARQAVPSATFLHGYYPCPLPADDFDLLIFSEILYFLDEDGLQALADDVSGNWLNAEVICVSYLGPSGNQLQGGEAVGRFVAALNETHTFQTISRAPKYRIDRGLPEGGK